MFAKGSDHFPLLGPSSLFALLMHISVDELHFFSMATIFWPISAFNITSFHSSFAPSHYAIVFGQQKTRSKICPFPRPLSRNDNNPLLSLSLSPPPQFPFIWPNRSPKMNPAIWLFAAILVILPSLIRRIFARIRQYREFVRLIDRLPGPSSLPIIGCALKFSPDNEKATYQMEYYFRKYTEDKDAPGIMRLWLGPKPIVIVYKPETAKVVLESNVLISKPFEYSLLQDWLGTGLLTSTGEKWHRRRKILTPAFHFKILQNFIQVFNRQSNTLIEMLDECVQRGYPFDFYRYIKLYALDIICEAAMGIQMHTQRGKNAKYVEAVKKMCELGFYRMRSPWLWPELIWRMSGKGHEFQQNLKAITDFTQGVISNRKRERQMKRTESKENGHKKNGIEGKTNEGKGNCFLDILLDLQEQSDFTDEDIREEVETFMFEGHDTVSSSLGFLVFWVGHRPHLQEKLFAEMTEIFGENMERDVQLEDMPKMRYAEQCIRETMRLLPTVPIIGRVITEETQIGDFLIPAGATVMVPPFAIHRDRRYFHNPDDFDPEHFSPDRVKARNKEPFAYLPFSAGPRNCIGQKFASTEQKITVAKIFRRYRVISTMHELENRGLPELVLKPSHGFWVRMERR